MKLKKLFYHLLPIFTFGVFIFSFHACQEVDQVESASIEGYEEISMTDARWSEDLLMPVGTKGYKRGNELKIVYPEGIRFVRFVKEDGILYSGNTTTVTCTAAAGCNNGCEPHLMNGMNIPTCSPCDPSGTCTMTTTSGDDGNQERKLEIREGTKGFEQNFSLFLDIEAGISAVKAVDLKNLVPAPDYLFALPEIAEAYDNYFEEKGYKNFNPSLADRTPEEFGLSPMNVFGYAVLMIVPKTEASIEMFDEASASRTPTCSCSGGGTGCNLESVKKLGITIGYKCARNGCNSCSMTVPEQ